MTTMIIIARDEYEGAEDEELIIYALRAILLGQWIIGHSVLDSHNEMLNPGLGSLSVREQLTVELTGEILKPILAYVIPNNPNYYNHPPLVKVTVTKYDIFLEFL